MLYAKIDSEGRAVAEDICVLRAEGKIIANPSKSMMRRLGYKPLVTVMPPEDYAGPLYPAFIEEEDRIIKIFKTEEESL